MNIPVSEPVLGDEEERYVLDALKRGEISGTFGKYISLFENEFSAYCGVKHGIATTSGTTALHLALASLGIKRGDEIIVSAFTNIATAYSVVYCGAKPVVVDSEPLTWNIDPDKIEDKISKKTRAIMPVHIYGHPVNMGPISLLAKSYKLFIVEDCAEAHGAEYMGAKVGSLGNIGCFSFYANKMIVTGEGGMIVTNDDEIAEHARLLRNLAFSTSRKFIHSHIGFNYRMSNIQAAIGLAQLKKIEAMIEKKRQIAHRYSSLLEEIDGLTLPVEMDYAKNVYWMYGLLVEEKKFGMTRDELMDELSKKGIETRCFFVPMNKQPVFLKMELFKNESCPVAEDLARRGLYLPSSPNLTEDQIVYIFDNIKQLHFKSRK